MRERPILFSAPMVRALLAGTKTQTRRVMKVQPEPPRVIYGSDGADTTVTPTLHLCENGMGVAWRFEMSKIASGKGHHLEAHFIDHEPVRSVCPYGAPGDRLWVRETWMDLQGTGIEATTGSTARCAYRADTPPGSYGDEVRKEHGLKWTPAIHMFRWASRITLEVTDVRAERLQDISRGDAMAEGCPFPNMAHGDDPRKWYAELWDEINGAGAWVANPWVWAVSFRMTPPSPMEKGPAR